MNRKEYVDWAVKVLTVVRSVWSTFSGEGASEWRESVHKEFIKTGITPKDYLDFVCSILHISRKVKIILLDGTVQEAKILDFLDMSYDLTDGRIEESIESGHPVCYCWCSEMFGGGAAAWRTIAFIYCIIGIITIHLLYFR